MLLELHFILLQADVSIGVEPTGGKTGKASSFILLAMNLAALPAALNMPFDVSPYVISQVIREARNYRLHAIQVRRHLEYSLERLVSNVV